MNAPSKRTASGTAGFSLVEVVISIGILSFALLAIVGLLPAGLKSVRNANEQAGAANVLESIAESIRSASTTSTSNFDSAIFTGSYAGIPFSYTNGITSPPYSCLITNLTLEGSATNALNKRLIAHVEITAPATSTTPGHALISVAWSAHPNPGWNSNNSNWSHVDGSLTTGIQFLPHITTSP